MVPGGGNPWGGRVWEIFYGSSSPPFPDLLTVLIPSLKIQEEILARRIDKTGGAVEDVWDQPQKQSGHLQACESLLGQIRHWPGVYRVHSTEPVYNPADIRNIINFNSGFALSLLAIALFIERGQATGFLEKSYIKRPLFRITSPLEITAYYFPGLVEKVFTTESLVLEMFSQSPKKEETILGQNLSMLQEGISFGDIGLLTRSGGLAVIAIENPEKITWEEAVSLVDRQLENKEYVVVNEETRQGRDLYARHGIQRGWQYINWDEDPS